MGRNRSLEEFLDADDTGDTDETEVTDDTDDTEEGGSTRSDAEGSDEDSPVDVAPQSGEGPTPRSPVGPVRPAHEWSPDGRPCDRCGETVTRRWLIDGDGEMACDDCKEW